MNLKDFDHPIVFSLAIFFVVIAWSAIFAWIFASLGWPGPLGLIKQGVAG